MAQRKHPPPSIHRRDNNLLQNLAQGQVGGGVFLCELGGAGALGWYITLAALLYGERTVALSVEEKC